MRVLCRNLIVLHFQRETLTKHHNRAEDSGLNRSPILQCSRMAILDSIADLSFVACCAIQLLPILSILSWLWIWAGIIVIIKIVNQIIATFAAIQECHSIRHKINSV